MSRSCSKIAARPSRSTTRAGSRRTSIRRRRADQADRHRGQRDGPYRLERWDRGAEVSLARNDGVLGRPGQERAGDRPLGRAIARSASASSRRATVDGIDDVDAGGRRGDRRRRRPVSSRRGTASRRRLPRRHAAPVAPFDDERVRRALAMGIDREQLVDVVLPARLELSPPTTRRAPSRTAAPASRGTSSTRRWPRRLLAAAGFPDGFDTTIHYPDAPTRRRPGPGRRRRRAPGPAPDNLGIRADARGRARRPPTAPTRRGQARRHPPARRSGAGLPGRERVLDPQLRAGCVEASSASRSPTSARRSRPDGRPTNGAKREAAYKKANDAIRAHVADHPDRGRRRRRRPSGPTSTARARRRSGSSASPTMAPGDRRQLVWLTTARAARPVLRRRDRPGRRAGLRPARRGPVRLRARRRRGRSRRSPARARRTRLPRSGRARCGTGVRFHDGATPRRQRRRHELRRPMGRRPSRSTPATTARSPTFAASFGGFLHPPAASP